jgi:hypothetical protein
MTTSIIRFVNIILVALLAGTSFGIWIGFSPEDYLVTTYIEQQQHLVHSLNSLMVFLVMMATLITIISAFVHRQSKTVFITLLFGAVFLASCIFISRFGNLPIQTEMLKWSPNSYPLNWTELRDKWWMYHILRTNGELIALILVTWSSVQKQLVK